MSDRKTGAVLLLVGFVDWFTRETVKTLFFDWVVHTMSPSTGALVEYGPPLAFGTAGLYLLWRSNVPKKQRTTRHMVSIVLITVGCLMAVVGALMYRAETGHFPLLAAGEAGQQPAGQPRQEQQATDRALGAATQTDAERPQIAVPNSETPPKQKYYSRPEIDGMLSTLVQLQRQLTSMPRLAEPVQKLVERRTGIFQPLPVSEFLPIADGLEQYSKQIERGLKEIERTLSDADEFVGSAPQERPRDAIEPFVQVLRGMIEALRAIGSGGANETVAAMALVTHRQNFLDSFMKYSGWLSSSQTKIAERIADLRGRDVR